jgi:hypothetical protein
VGANMIIDYIPRAAPPFVPAATATKR